MLAFLLLKRKKLKDPWYKKYFGTLYLHYRPHAFYYEFISVSRRSLLIGAALLGQSLSLSYSIEGFEFQLIILLLTIYLIIHIWIKPYHLDFENTMETLSLILLILITASRGSQSFFRIKEPMMYITLSIITPFILFLVIWCILVNKYFKMLFAFLWDKLKNCTKKERENGRGDYSTFSQ